MLSKRTDSTSGLGVVHVVTRLKRIVIMIIDNFVTVPVDMIRLSS